MHFDVSKTVGSVLYFREHAMLAKTAGVKHLVVLVNKMDDPTVEWDEGRLVFSGTNCGLSISCLEIHYLSLFHLSIRGTAPRKKRLAHKEDGGCSSYLLALVKKVVFGPLSVFSLVSSVGRAPVYCAGGRWFKPQTGPTLRVLK